ncbi:ATP-binding protein [Streptomyces bluensis]|uniref:ATP-binding protein n=1 Tax=Streptomyces bluensis TaxID=33897 RepID=A0ABW6UKW1_9ACTN
MAYRGALAVPMLVRPTGSYRERGTKVFRSGNVTQHDLAGGQVLHRQVNLYGVDEPLALVRKQVREVLGGRAADTQVDDAVLVAVELVTNALRHTSSGPARMDLDVYEDTAILWVHDGDTDAAAVRPRAHGEPSSRVELQEGGRGLHLVDALATRWLVWPTAGGKAVVAEIGLLAE